MTDYLHRRWRVAIVLLGAATPECSLLFPGNYQLTNELTNYTRSGGDPGTRGSAAFCYIPARHDRDHRRVPALPDFAFHGEINFLPGAATSGASVMITAEVPLLESEVNPFVNAVVAGGLSPGAIHNHYFWRARESSLCTSKAPETPRRSHRR